MLIGFIKKSVELIMYCISKY